VRIVESRVPREAVIKFYVNYDRRKKKCPVVGDLDTWPWDRADALDERLGSHNLKSGALSGYRSWWFVELDLIDLLDCAIVNHIFPHHPQSLASLIGKGVIEEWEPTGDPEWWEPLSAGCNLSSDWALILRPAVATERPAKWYLEDGSGRALALLKRMLRHGEPWRTAHAYLAVVSDESSSFIRSRPELSSSGDR
jgi:hypothetical protein